MFMDEKNYAAITIDKKRDEVKPCIIESLEYFNGTPREIWFDNMATVMVKEGKHKKVVVYKYKRKTGYHNKNGHRQSYTKVKIEKINA